MEKLIAKVNEILSKFCIVCKVPCDKQMHFICGFIIAAVLTPFIGAASVFIVAIIAALKEIYDFLHPDKHTADIWDWVATTLGGVVGFVVVALF
jgi:heme/copper-type cytochrome/quinol oxidase subunit 4